MNDIIWIVIFLIFLFSYKLLDKYLYLYQIFLVLICIFFIFQYIFINSNPYRNFNTNKLTILDNISPKYKPISEYYNPQKNYKYPFILKPVICTGKSKNVSLIYNNNELIKYFRHNMVSNTMYQEFINTDFEVGILYERNPLYKKGNIKSLVMRTFLKRDKLQLKTKLGFINDHYNFIDLHYLITPRLNRIIDNISQKIPHFYVGRYDIRCTNLQQLSMGNFYILEVNGQMGFDLIKECFPYSYLNFNIWVFIKLRWLFIRLYYGLINILTFNSVNIRILFIAIYSTINCQDIEQLFEPLS